MFPDLLDRAVQYSYLYRSFFLFSLREGGGGGKFWCKMCFGNYAATSRSGISFTEVS